MSIRLLRAGLPGLAMRSFPSLEALPTRSSAIASFRPRLASTTPASTMNCRFRPSTVSRPATFHRSGSAMCPASFPNASPRISRYRSARPTPSLVRSIRPAAGANGFQNLDTTFKYRVYKNPEHEFVMSVGVSVEWGGTGAKDVGAEPFNSYTPTIYFGKGFGDLPGHTVLDQAGRDHRSGRLCDPGAEFHDDLWHRSR